MPCGIVREYLFGRLPLLQELLDCLLRTEMRTSTELSHTAQIRERQKDSEQYLKIAMQTVYQDVPAKSECIVVGQGVHMLPDLERNGEKLLFVLNGKVSTSVDGRSRVLRILLGRN